MLSIYPSIKGGRGGGGGGGGGCSFKARIDRSIIVKDLSLGWKKKLEDKKINGGTNLFHIGNFIITRNILRSSTQNDDALFLS